MMRIKYGPVFVMFLVRIYVVIKTNRYMKNFKFLVYAGCTAFKHVSS